MKSSLQPRQSYNPQAEPLMSRRRQRRWRKNPSVIAELKPVLRGWGPYVRTGNAAGHFIDGDACVVKWLRSLRLKRAGCNLRAGQTTRRDRDYFEILGLHGLRGTIRYPGKSPGNGSSAQCCEPTDHWQAVCGKSACTV